MKLKLVLALVAAGVMTLSAAPSYAQPTGCGTATTFTSGQRSYVHCSSTVRWGNARDNCAGYSPDGTAYYLVRIDDMTENNNVDTLIGGNDAWIGADDIASEMQWRWTFGNTLFCSNSAGSNGCMSTSGYNNWDPGIPEPNNGDSGNPDQHCAVMRQVDGRWDDRNCAHRGNNPGYGAGNSAESNRWVCEGIARCGNNVLNTSGTAETCDDGNQTPGDGCSATCQRETGYVCTGAGAGSCTQVCSTTPATTYFGGSTYRFCNGPGTKTRDNAATYCGYLGGTLVAINSAAEQQHVIAQTGGLSTWTGGTLSGGVWSWPGGTQFYNQTTHVSTLYSAWSIGQPDNSGTCAYLWGSQESRWDDFVCTQNLAFVCESSDGRAQNCGDTVVTGPETCDDGPAPVSGDGCSATCQVERGFYCPPAGGPCIAACTLPGNFYSRFPMDPMAQPAALAAESNYASREYVTCPGLRNAYVAESVCTSFGSDWHLASVQSAVESTRLHQRAAAPGLGVTRFWIGATDEENPAFAGNEENDISPPGFTPTRPQGAFRWRSGTAVGTYTNWLAAQPNDDGFGQDCAESNGGVWDDINCQDTRAFVCEGTAFCGNGAVAMPEACDDANTNNTDGCTNACTVIPGYGCLLPGGEDDNAPVLADCAFGASCCYLAAQAVVSDVRVVGGELEWTTLSESGTLGFYVSVQSQGEWVPAHEGLLPALPDAAQGAVYRLRASGLRGKTIRIVEHEQSGPSLTVFEGVARSTGGASTLGGRTFAVTANALTGGPDMPVDAAPSAAGRAKAAGDQPTGVFALAAADGLLRVTFAEIAEALQVPVATVASRVASGELSVREHGNAVAWTRAEDEHDAIVFVARRRDSVYSGTRPYEIGLSAGNQLVAVERGMDDEPTGEGQLRYLHEVDTFPALAVSPDPTQEFWFERSLGNHSAFQDYPATFTLDNVDGAAATFDLSYYAAPGLSGESPLTLTMTINGQAVGTIDVTSTGLGVARFALPAGALQAGPNTVQVRATSALPAGTALAYVDAFQVTYGAPLEFAAEGRFEATADGALSFEVDSESDAPMWIVDVTSDERVTATRTAIDATRARFTIDAQDGHEYFVATEAGLMAPTALRARSEQHFADSSRAAEYVVIAPVALYDAATALAARRQTQGLTTAVVDVQDIYDAFGAGEQNPYAIREFLRVARTSWGTAPRYVLLLGDGNYDYRGATVHGSGSIPPMLVQTERGVYASDMALGDTDADGQADLAIGRVPAHTALEADAFVQRVVTYESGDLDAFTRHALLVSGTNRGEDFTRYVNTLETQLDTRVNAERIDRGALSLADARTQLLGAINDGSFWFHYQGHGASNQLDDDGLLTMADVAGLTNSEALTIFTGMSCSTSRFEVPGMDSISELMLSGSPGGAIALYGPSGPGYSYESGNISEAFQRGLLTGNNLVAGRMGDVVLGLWDRNTGGARASQEQLSIYLLLGDPATKLPDRSRLAPPPVVVDPTVDGGTVEPTVDGGGRGDAGGRPVDPVIPNGALGGGACTVSMVSDTPGTASGLVLLLGLFVGIGRRARRRER